MFGFNFVKKRAAYTWTFTVNDNQYWDRDNDQLTEMEKSDSNNPNITVVAERKTQSHVKRKELSFKCLVILVLEH